MVTISDIKPYAKNAKVHSSEQLKALAKIVKEVGWRQPVLVNQKGIIVAGHGRFEAWQKFKKEFKLPDIWVLDDKGALIHGEPEKTPLTKSQEAAYRLADNKLNESRWDMALVVDEMAELDTNFQELTGFDDHDLKLDLSNSNTEIEISNLKTKHECPKCHFTF